MLAAVVLTALLRSEPSVAVSVTAIAVTAAAILAGGYLSRRIRRSERLQLGSAAAIPLVGVPIEVAGGLAVESIAVTAVAWAVVFTASALDVRASLARTSRTRRDEAARLQLGAIALPLAATALFALTGFVAHAAATLVATCGSAVLAIARPGAKHLRAVGLSLAGIAALSVVALAQT